MYQSKSHVTLNLWGETQELRVKMGKYALGGGLSVQLTEGGMPFCTLSVNVLGVKLASNEVVIKDYSENREVWLELLKAKPGWFRYTGREIGVGRVMCGVFRLTETFWREVSE